MKTIELQRKSYQNRFKEYGATPNGVYWNNKETQYQRFERLVANFDLSSSCPSIHDVGSGVCDFHSYLNSKKINHEYSGTEIVQEMIDHSLSEYPDIELFNRDIVLDNISNKYDYVFLSGTLNLLNGQEEEVWKEYCYALIKKMYSISRKGIAFNCLTTYSTFADPSLNYLDPKDIFDFCQTNLSRFVILDHGYPFFEFTVTVYRLEYLAEKFPSEEYSKYLK
jgi:hypothetical protein